MKNLQDPIVVVVGPTASGKSDLSIALAQELDGEVVVADSMQVYRGMNIGTAKVPPEEQVVKHHCIDIVSPGEPFSAALFQRFARNAFLEIAENGKRPILSGGTGFYIRAAIDEYEFVEGDQIDNPVRDKYLSMAEYEGCEAVWRELEEKDPESAALLHSNDLKRVVRALEMLEAGESYAHQKRKLSNIKQAFPAIILGIEVDPDVLRNRINARVDKMREQGLVEEVQALLDSGFRNAITSNQAIGYKEIVAALDGECTLDEAFEAIKAATRRYAKRQRTWFRADKRIEWIAGTSGSINKMLRSALSKLKHEGNDHGTRN